MNSNQRDLLFPLREMGHSPMLPSSSNSVWYLVVAVFLLLFALVPAQLTAQEKGVIRGIILEKGSSQRVSNVTISNMRTKRGTASDLRGEFALEVQVGDSLMLTKIGYQPLKTEINTLSEILLELTPSSIRLDAVSIDQESKDQRMQEILDGYRRQGNYSQGKPKVMGYIFQPITSLYERFSKSGRQARRFRSYMDFESQALVVDRIFSAYKVGNLTGLSGKDLLNFMQIYRPTFEQAEFWNDYDVAFYVKQSLAKFEADGRPEPQRLPKIPIPPQQK
jgi:hypothetical protein